MIATFAAVNVPLALGVPMDSANVLIAKTAQENCASYTAIGSTVDGPWCDANCKLGNCPADLCQCTGAAGTEAASAPSAPSVAAPGIGVYDSALRKLIKKEQGPAAESTPVDEVVTSHGQQGNNESHEPAALQSEAACACSAKCDTGAPGNCSEALEGCSPNIEYIEGVAVLEHNSHYRLSDITDAVGTRYRYDSVAVLCEPRYRKTLLRDALVRSSTLDGAPLSDLCGGEPSRSTACGQAVERAVSEKAEPKPGWAKMQGVTGESSLALSTGGEKEAALASALSGKLHSGECQKFPKNTLVVSVRMGDVFCDDSIAQKHAPKIRSLVKATKEMINRTADDISHVRFSGVMHYVSGSSKRTKKCDADNRDFVQSLLEAAKSKGLPGVRIHSEVDADNDLCTFVYSPHVLLPATIDTPTGHSVLVKKLRIAAEQPKAGSYNANGLASDEEEAAEAWAAKTAETARRHEFCKLGATSEFCQLVHETHD
jgi:hypothetical protein